MDPQHPPEVCPHCANGCTHPHDIDDPMTVEVEVLAPVPSVRGSIMRRGGAVTDPATGLTIASDQWVRLRCKYCGHEAMTPIEAVRGHGWADDEHDQFTTICWACTDDIRLGRSPGHNRRRRRGARR